MQQDREGKHASAESKLLAVSEKHLQSCPYRQKSLLTSISAAAAAPTMTTAPAEFNALRRLYFRTFCH